MNNLEQLALYLQSNELGDLGAKTVTEIIYQMKNLKQLHLSLGNNHIKIDGAKSIAENISKMNNLTTLKLYLYGNKIAEKDKLEEQLKKHFSNIEFVIDI